MLDQIAFLKHFCSTLWEYSPDTRQVMMRVLETTKERKVLGYIQDINHDMERQTKLRQQAQTDALTGILNVGAGRSRIRKLLSTTAPVQRAMNFPCSSPRFRTPNRK